MLYFWVYFSIFVIIALFIITEVVDAKYKKRLETAKRECKSYNAVVRCKDKGYTGNGGYDYSCNIVANNGKSHIFKGYDHYMNLYPGQKVILLEHIIYGKNQMLLLMIWQ